MKLQILIYDSWVDADMSKKSVRRVCLQLLADIKEGKKRVGREYSGWRMA